MKIPTISFLASLLLIPSTITSLYLTHNLKPLTHLLSQSQTCNLCACAIKKYSNKSYLNAPEVTLALIKPGTTQANRNEIISIIKKNGYLIRGIQIQHLTKGKAQKFYSNLINKPFYSHVINYMTSEPIIIMVLQKENAVNDWRQLIGHTNPSKADSDTIRAHFGVDREKNTVHGSDCQESAQREINCLMNSYNPLATKLLTE